ncbi:MAG: septum formation initiator [Lachnospiraceae bacterium]|jgi:cell division protein DivIC|nr:septum formation initiator [Lachnospiraceae bacterium]MBP3241980.1 septum formation initiator [Oribacterium sp.]
MKNRRRNKNEASNRLAIIGITIVVLCIAFAIHMRSVTLREQAHEYQLQEESLQAEIDEQKRLSEELEQKKIYVKTKEFTMEKAREIFGLKLPDEIIIKPDTEK